MLNRRQTKQAMGELWQNAQRQKYGRGLSGLMKYRAAREAALNHDKYLVTRWRMRRITRLLQRLVNDGDRMGACHALPVVVFTAVVDGQEQEYKAWYNDTCCGPSWVAMQWHPFNSFHPSNIEPDVPVVDIRFELQSDVKVEWNLDPAPVKDKDDG